MVGKSLSVLTFRNQDHRDVEFLFKGFRSTLQRTRQIARPQVDTETTPGAGSQGVNEFKFLCIKTLFFPCSSATTGRKIANKPRNALSKSDTMLMSYFQKKLLFGQFD